MESKATATGDNVCARPSPPSKLAWAILDGLPKPLLVVSQDSQVHYANRQAAAWFALDQDMLMRSTCASLLGPNIDLEALRELARNHTPFIARLPDGRRLDVALDLSVLPNRDAAGRRLFTLCLSDVTAIDKLRQERDRLMRLASTGAQMPTLLHELRKPLANLSAVLEGVEMLGGPLDPKLVQALLMETRRMALMLETTGASVRALRCRTRARIDQDLRECRALLARVAWRQGIALDWMVEDMPPLPLDPGVLRSVLCNLIANALDACEPGDHVEVHAEIVTEDNGDRSFRLLVRDTGAGMSEESLRRCTEPFYSTKTGGCGIGLALCRDILEGGGGRLELESEPQVGTTIQVIIEGL